MVRNGGHERRLEADLRGGFLCEPIAVVTQRLFQQYRPGRGIHASTQGGGGRPLRGLERPFSDIRAVTLRLDRFDNLKLTSLIEPRNANSFHVES
jgi:hypothetical protein